MAIAKVVANVLGLMKQKEKIRNIGVIVHIDHGKTTLTDSLLAAAGVLSSRIAGEARMMDLREDEQERGITIKTTGISLFHELEETEYIINLQDTPGHVDFSGEVTSALRVVDGALVVVDAVEGCMVQTEIVTRQALDERVRPVLFINKIDRLITEMRMTPEEAYEQLVKIVRDYNLLIDTYAAPEFKDKWNVSPVGGSVAFGSAKHRWGFTIPSLAKAYSSKTGKDPKELVKPMWQKSNFVKLMLAPLYQIYQSAEDGNKDFLKKAMEVIGITLADDEWIAAPKELAKTILERWLPVANAILDMIVKFVPNPLEAQPYRAFAAWTGTKDSPIAEALDKVDENGPVMIAISKMIPMRAKQIVAMGRIFSGTIRSGQRIKVLLPGYQPGRKDRNFTTNIQQVSILMGKETHNVDAVPAGNIVALYGIRGAFSGSTVTSLDEVEPFEALHFAVEPVVTISVEPKNPTELPRLVDGLKLMELVDGSLKTVINEETGEYLISGTGELHLEITIKDLQDLQKLEVTTSKPIVVFRESVSAKSIHPVLAKSPNKHNRIWLTSEPLDKQLAVDLENKKVPPYLDDKSRAALLRETYNWDRVSARGLWGFGPEHDDTNAMVDQTKGIQYLREIRDYTLAGFRWASKEGPICGEPMYGVRFNIEDVKLHEDTIHRGVAQVMPAARKSCYGAFLNAQPILLEPIYQAQIQAPEDQMGSIYKVLTKRRGKILDTQRREGTPLVVILGELPVAESFGLVAELRSETSGSAFSQLTFLKWARMPENVMKSEEDGGGISRLAVEETRQRKGYRKAQPPKPSDYKDTL